MAAYFAVLKPGDRILGMNLAHGGHLTHGMAINFCGLLYEVHAYGVREDDQRIDYDALEATGPGGAAEGHRRRRQRLPAHHRLRAHGAPSPQRSDALLIVDMAHIAGLVAAGAASQPRSRTRHRHHDHPQDPARPARRPACLCKARAGQGGRPVGLPGHPGRAADARHRRQGGRASSSR